MRKAFKAFAWRLFLEEYCEGLVRGMELGNNATKFRLKKKFNELELEGSGIPNLYTLADVLKVVDSIG